MEPMISNVESSKGKEHKHCPKCGTPWEHEETICEYFTKKYTEEGIPERILKENRNLLFMDKEAAMKTAGAITGAFYGCTPETPRYFGKNVVGIELDRDCIEYWECRECKVCVNRFTGEFYSKRLNAEGTSHVFTKI